VIDSRPRIARRESLLPKDNLADLEHARLEHMMIAPEWSGSANPADDPEDLSPRQLRKRRQSTAPPLAAYSWWLMPRATVTALLLREQRFRDDRKDEETFVLLP